MLHMIQLIWLKGGCRGRGEVDKWARFETLEASYKLQEAGRELCDLIFKCQRERENQTPRPLI